MYQVDAIGYQVLFIDTPNCETTVSDTSPIIGAIHVLNAICNVLKRSFYAGSIYVWGRCLFCLALGLSATQAWVAPVTLCGFGNGCRSLYRRVGASTRPPQSSTAMQGLYVAGCSSTIPLVHTWVNAQAC
jgi:hypothetical protein